MTDAATSAGSETTRTDSDVTDDPAEVDPSGTEGRWSSLQTLWIHAALLLVALLALLPVIDNGFIALPDEGVYSAQAQNLAEGAWAGPRPAPDVDPDGRFDAIGPSAILGDRDIPHSRNPLYPTILWLAYEAAGNTGLLAVSVLGAWGAAVATAFLARRLRRPYGVPALWLCGLGTPLVFSAYVVMGQALVAAACASLLLALAATLDGRRPAALPAALVSTALMVAVRSEGTIAAAAIGGTVVLMALPIPRHRRLDIRSALIGAAVLVTGAVTYRASTWWTTTITAGADAGTQTLTLPLERDPLSAAWIALLRPWESGLNAEAAVLMIVVALVLAAVVLRVVPRLRLLSVGLLVAASLAAVVLVFRPPNLITGLLPAFPLLVAVIFLERADLRRPPVIRLVGVLTLATVALTLTIYGDGGASQWGGRFFHVLIPAAVPLVLVGLDGARRRLEPKEAVIGAVCLALVTLSITTVGLRSNAENRTVFEQIVRATAAEVQAGAGGGRQLVVYGTLSGDGIARSFWDQRDTMDVLRSSDPRLIFTVVGSAAEAGVDRVIVVTTVDAKTLRFFDRGLLERIGWEPSAELPINEAWRLVVLEPA